MLNGSLVTCPKVEFDVEDGRDGLQIWVVVNMFNEQSWIPRKEQHSSFVIGRTFGHHQEYFIGGVTVYQGDS
jgi:hypothetical protein